MALRPRRAGRRRGLGPAPTALVRHSTKSKGKTSATRPCFFFVALWGLWLPCPSPAPLFAVVGLTALFCSAVPVFNPCAFPPGGNPETLHFVSLFRGLGPFSGPAGLCVLPLFVCCCSAAMQQQRKERQSQKLVVGCQPPGGFQYYTSNSLSMNNIVTIVMVTIFFLDKEKFIVVQGFACLDINH